MSLSTLFGLGFVCILVSVVLNLGIVLSRELPRYLHARADMEKVVDYKAVLDAVNLISAERAPSAILLSQGGAPRPEDREALDRARRATDTALAAIGPFDGNIWPAPAQVDRALTEARRRIDDLASSEAPVPPDALDEAMAQMFDAANAFLPLIEGQKLALLQSNPAIYGAAHLAHSAVELREYAGRLGALLFPRLLNGIPLSAAKEAEFASIQGRIAQTLRLMPRDAALDRSAAFSRAMRAVDEMYVGRGLAVMARWRAEAGQAGAEGPSSRELFDAYFATIAPLTEFRNLVIDEMVAHVEAERVQSRNLIALSLVMALVVSLPLVGFLVVVRRSLMAPLIRAHDSILALSREGPCDLPRDFSSTAD